MHLPFTAHRKQKPGELHKVRVNLQGVNQLFNTIDSSPFREKDLDDDAEKFIVSWTQEFPLDEPVSLVINLKEQPSDDDLPPSMIEDAVQHYFAYRAGLIRMEFKQLLRDGRQALLIGGLFLIGCLGTSNIVLGSHEGTFMNIMRESLTIAGWVGMWRPMEIFLYEWWPLRRRLQVYLKMSKMKVELTIAHGKGVGKASPLSAR